MLQGVDVTVMNVWYPKSGRLCLTAVTLRSCLMNTLQVYAAEVLFSGLQRHVGVVRRKSDISMVTFLPSSMPKFKQKTSINRWKTEEQHSLVGHYCDNY
jgi:hypothetical protein